MGSFLQSAVMHAPCLRDRVLHNTLNLLEDSSAGCFIFDGDGPLGSWVRASALSRDAGCRQQRIVISSIHQPRAAIWDLFTKVQVLSEGRMLYFGATSRGPPLPPPCSPHPWPCEGDLLNMVSSTDVGIVWVRCHICSIKLHTGSMLSASSLLSTCFLQVVILL